ncbi:MAG: phosphoenolpyruvate carboxylase, partial [Candidatus Levybacteria bacterium]|nr:phosphoenolpyruvate carboxylase [Candidatus Levybacteria bacterium]
LRIVMALKQTQLLEKYYVNIKSDLERAGRYLSRENLLLLIKQSPEWAYILDDVEAIEKYLGKNLGPVTESEKRHVQLSGEILKSLDKGGKTQEYIEKAALLRQSMG